MFMISLNHMLIIMLASYSPDPHVKSLQDDRASRKLGLHQRGGEEPGEGVT
jgi:hypothetical protein